MRSRRGIRPKNDHHCQKVSIVRTHTCSVLSNFVDYDTVSAAVVQATCEMARELLIVDRTAAAPGEGISATQTSQATHDASGGSSGMTSVSYSKDDTRPIVSRVVQAMLAKFGVLVSGGSGTVRLVRG
jgi:hypothetical protein